VIETSGCVSATLRHQDAEFFTAHACDHVTGPAATLEQLAKQTQRAVAALVAVQVIDLLEMIKIETEQGQRQAMTARVRENI
jgi:hypothetical protein